MVRCSVGVGSRCLPFQECLFSVLNYFSCFSLDVSVGGVCLPGSRTVCGYEVFVDTRVSQGIRAGPEAWDPPEVSSRFGQVSKSCVVVLGLRSSPLCFCPRRRPESPDPAPVCLPSSPTWVFGVAPVCLPSSSSCVSGARPCAVTLVGFWVCSPAPPARGSPPTQTVVSRLR